MTTALPPSILHSSHPTTPESAHTFLTTFLIHAANSPAYRPDSTLSERGPISASSLGNTNLTLNHLNRMKLGLEGIRVGGEIEDPETVMTGTGARGTKRKRSAAEEEGEKVQGTEGDAEWQEKDDYELAQDEEEVDHNQERDPGARLEQPGDEVEAAQMLEVEVEGAGTSRKDSQTKVDKEERKRLKKQRDLEARKREEKEGRGRSSKKKGRGKEGEE